MVHGSERIEWIKAALAERDVDALLCTLPENVLVLSGYWPVVGTAIAAATRTGMVAVLAPSDEQELARRGWAEVCTYHPGSLASLLGPADAVQEPIAALLQDLDVSRKRIAYDDGSVYEGASYAAMYLYGTELADVVRHAAPRAALVSGSDAVAALRSRMTDDEVDQVRLACQIAGRSFTAASGEVRPGLREPEVAAAFATPMTVQGLAHRRVERTDAFTWCMSGPNSALAGAAYARTRNRELQQGDFVLVHCNSNVNGYWTDITRTYCLGNPDERQRAMYDAVFSARTAALAVVHPGASAADVDRAARRVLEERGFGEYFTHGIGHNVGFSVISADYPPRLHPASSDQLEIGMTFNVEPAIYIKGYGGVRQCDVVTVREEGADVLTPFQVTVDELVIV